MTDAIAPRVMRQAFRSVRLGAGQDGAPFGLTLAVVFGLLIRLACVAVLPAVGVYDDERTYDFLGTYVRFQLETGAEKPWSFNAWGNVSGVLRLFYDDPTIVRLFNVLLSLVTAFLLYVAFRRWSDLSGRASAIAIAILLSPLTIFISVLTLKEQAVGFALAVVGISPLFKFAARATFAAAGLALLLALRFDIGLVTGCVLVAHTIFSRMLSTGGSKATVRRLMLASAILGVTGYIAINLAGHLEATGIRSTKAGQFIVGTALRGGDLIRQNRTAVFNRFANADNVLSPMNLVLAPLRAVYSPSPVAVVTKALRNEPVLWSDIVQGVLAMVIYAITPAAAMGLFKSLRDGRLFMIGAGFMIVFLASAMSALSLAPEMFRYRWPALPLFVALAVIGRERSPTASMVKVGWWLSAIAGMTLYVWFAFTGG